MELEDDNIFTTPKHDGIKPMPTKQHDIVQVKNPRSGHYVKIDRTAGRIVAHKKSDGPYKNIPVARKRK